MKLEVGRFGVERLGPHDVDLAGVPTGQTAASHGIGHVVTIADLDDVGRHAAAGAHGPAVPGPAVVGDQAAAAGAESVVLAIGLNDRRGIVNVGFAIELRQHAPRRAKREQGETPPRPED